MYLGYMLFAPKFDSSSEASRHPFPRRKTMLASDLANSIICVYKHVYIYMPCWQETICMYVYAYICTHTQMYKSAYYWAQTYRIYVYIIYIYIYIYIYQLIWYIHSHTNVQKWVWLATDLQNMRVCICIHTPIDLIGCVFDSQVHSLHTYIRA